MVATNVVVHGVFRYLENVILQLLQIAHTTNDLVSVRIAEEKVAKAKVLGNSVAKVNVELL